MLWCMDSTAALKCNGCRFESWLAGHLKKAVYAEGVNFLSNGYSTLTSTLASDITMLVNKYD